MMYPLRSKTQLRGYIAIVSAIILSAILTGLAFTSSTSIFLTRFGERDDADKMDSDVVARSCVYEALYDAAQGVLYADSKQVAVSTDTAIGDESCTIDSASEVGNVITFYTHAVVGSSYTTFRVTAIVEPTSGLSITSWTEIAGIPP